MHELGLIQEVVDSVLEQALDNGIKRVTLIKLSIGKLSGVLPQALQFGFDAIKQGTELEGTQLVITEIAPLLYCSSCNYNFTSEEWLFSCRKCGSNEISIIEGQELILEYFEGISEGEEINDKSSFSPEINEN